AFAGAVVAAGEELPALGEAAGEVAPVGRGDAAPLGEAAAVAGPVVAGGWVAAGTGVEVGLGGAAGGAWAGAGGAGRWVGWAARGAARAARAPRNQLCAGAPAGRARESPIAAASAASTAGLVVAGATRGRRVVAKTLVVPSGSADSTADPSARSISSAEAKRS